jgi:hypothetical protein
VISIYAYDARLSDPSSELELISFNPPPPDRTTPEPTRVRRTTPAGATDGPRSTRPVLIDHTNNPLNVPHEVSAIASPIPPAHPGTVIGPAVIEPGGSGPGRDGGDSNTSGDTGPAVVEPHHHLIRRLRNLFLE